MQGSVVVTKLSKKYRRFSADRPRSVKEIFVRRQVNGKAKEFLALSEVSFNVLPGQIIGVIGRNGAGKSTLLRLLGGVGVPDEGKIEVKQPVRGLLDLGVGFHPDLTGEEK